jgi:hypothetical protein
VKSIIQFATAAKRWLSERAPVPMAAPETAALKRARLRILYALAALGLICFAWGLLPTSIAPEMSAVIVGLTVFLALQVPVWAIAKSRADDAWLFRDRDDA